ncbi:MAG: hypothetical protein JJE39_17185 [Vicinamibacteria bacterium]|nr:hypothetical protein [Vicinamibacteria bacterium]
MRFLLRAALVIALVTPVVFTRPVSAQVKGVAQLGLTRPVTKVEGKVVVTRFKIKNNSKETVVGLRIDEYWYDKEGNPSPGDTKQLKSLAPGVVTAIELRTPITANMNSNTYQFSHANGTVATKVFASLQ